MAVVKPPRERAERIARSHACGKCGEYSWKKVKLAPAEEPERIAFQGTWQAELLCGVCDTYQVVVITEDGDLIPR